MPKGRHKKKLRGAAMYKKSRILKRQKMRTLKSVSRKAQPSPVITVPRLVKVKKGQTMGGMVSSSWIASLEYNGKWVIMSLLNGYVYAVYIPQSIWEKWYYATSKGTFFNGNIKDKYKVVRVA